MGLLTSRLSIAALLLLGLVGCQSLRIPGVPRDAGWPDDLPELGRTNAADEAVALPLSEAWVYNANAGFGPGGPLLFDEYVLVANRKGEVHALEWRSGKKVGVESFGDVINGSPAVSGGSLFVPLDYGSRRVLTAWDLSKGGVLWSVKDGSSISTSLTVIDGQLIVVDREGVVKSLSASEGVELWQTTPDSTSQIHASPISGDNESVLVVTSRGLATRISGANGTVAWSRQLPQPVYQTPAWSGNLIVLTGTRGWIGALDARTGAVRWEVQVSTEPVKLTAPAISGELVVVAGTDGLVRALNAVDGSLRWETTLSTTLVAPPFVASNHVFVGTMDARLVALEREAGDVVWEKELRGRVKSALAVSGGDVYVMCEPRFLYRFTTESQSSSDVSLSDGSTHIQNYARASSR